MTRAAVTSVAALWWREIVRFVRQRSRLVGAFAQPLLFWVLLGGGFSASFRAPGTPGDVGALQYFYPGIIALVLLFTAIFATIAVVEDRKAGFLQGVLVAPIPRGSIVLGRYIGDGEPLCFAVYAIKRLITGIGKFQKPIGAFLNGRSGEGERWKQEKKREKCSAMHGRSLTAFAQSCEARSLVGTDRRDVRKILPGRLPCH